jgi:hypothetical protein
MHLVLPVSGPDQEGTAGLCLSFLICYIYALFALLLVTSAPVADQADLRLVRERLRRKAAIVARQEEEVTAKERALETAAVDAQALQHTLDQARSDASKHQVSVFALVIQVLL